MITEKDRRIYYQDIVYQVCNALDRIDGKTPGHGIVCGTFEHPSADVCERMDALVQEVIALRRLLRWADGEYDFASLFSGCGCTHGFKPASACENTGCARAEMNRLYLQLLDMPTDENY